MGSERPSSQGQPREDEVLCAPGTLGTGKVDHQARRLSVLGPLSNGGPRRPLAPLDGECPLRLAPRLHLVLAEASPSQHVRSRFLRLSTVTWKQKYSGGRRKVILKNASTVTELMVCHREKQGQAREGPTVSIP